MRRLFTLPLCVIGGLALAQAQSVTLKPGKFKPPANVGLQKTLIESLRLRDPLAIRLPDHGVKWVVSKTGLSAKAAKALAMDVDLRPKIDKFALAVKDQGSRGTCSVFAMTFLLEYNYALWEDFSSRHLSEEYLNWAANAATNNNDDGDWFSRLALGFKKYGIAQDTAAPYSSTFQPGWSPPTYARNDAVERAGQQKFWVVFDDPEMGISQDELDSVTKLLDASIPVAIGQAWPDTKLDGKYKVENLMGIDCLTDASGTLGGHSMVAVGYKRTSAFPGGGYFVFRNSWGSSSWDQGYWILSFSYVRKYAYDAYAAGWDGIK
ncbi:MAG: C1 family peptidase [Bryobacteraceae bacterium]